MSKAPNWDDQPKMKSIDHETQRRRQGELVEEAIVAGERGQHVHYYGGGTQWCNADPTCSDSRPVSELLV